jgi:hypothetical protein
VLDPNLASTYNDLIQDIFNKNDKVNLILVEGITPGAYGSTGKAEIDQYGKINVTVTLDPDKDKIGNKTEEFAASTIIHEAFHAIVNYLSNNSVSGDDQHVALFSNYLDLLAKGLRAAYPNMGYGDEKGLILKGLVAKETIDTGKWPPSLIDKILDKSGYSREQVDNIKRRYESRSSGTPCN